MSGGEPIKAKARRNKRSQSSIRKSTKAGWEHAFQVIDTVCTIAGSSDMLAHPDRLALHSAIERHDTPFLFEWLVQSFSFQGISDAAARGYMDRHGRIKWANVERAVHGKSGCSKLWTHWTFQGCGYEKTKASCSQPEHFDRCPLPRFDLRSGRLNVMAISLYLFLRDVAGGDLVAFIDERLQLASLGPLEGRLARMRNALVEPLEEVFSLGRKVLSMALSDLLLAAGRERSIWREVGASFIAIDTLLHNFLMRSGVLRRLYAEHAYGRGCYEPNGCAAIIEKVSRNIDARRCNANYPKRFARWVQHSCWLLCAADGVSACNGNRIDDQRRCRNAGCLIYPICDRVALHPPPREPPKRLA